MLQLTVFGAWLRANSLQELDLEHTRGVKILECASDRLVLQARRTRSGQSEWSGLVDV